MTDILEYYGLREDPFKLTPDPMFFFPSVIHNEALLSMNYVVKQREGFCLITGEPGTGKTMLLNVFKESWKDRAEIAMILTPRLSPEEFLLSVLEDLNVKLTRTNKNDILKAFRDFLIEKSQMGMPVIIIVDEAQNLPDETLEELRLLSNLETDKDKLLQIILIGQPELEHRLNRDVLRQLNQRIMVRAKLSPLSTNETLEYINYRLIKAGKGFLQFEEKLPKRIHEVSSGIPRIINILSSRAIMSAYLEGSNVVTQKHINYAIKHLKGSIISKEIKRPLQPVYAFSLVISIVIAVIAGYYIYTAYSVNPVSFWTSLIKLQKTGEVEVKKAAPVVSTNTTVSQVVQSPVESTNINPVEKETKASEVRGRKGKTVTVIVNSATLRSRPSWNSEPVAWVSKGNVFEVVGDSPSDNGRRWYRIKTSDGREGWIADKVVSVKNSKE